MSNDEKFIVKSEKENICKEKIVAYLGLFDIFAN